MNEPRHPDDATLAPGPGYLAGHVYPSRWRAPSSLPGDELWATDQGIVVGITDWQRTHVAGEVAYVRTDAHIGRPDADELASGELVFIPWERIRSGRVREHGLTPHELHLVLTDGTERIIWRGTPLRTASDTEAAWQELRARLARHVVDVTLERAAASRRWLWVIHPRVVVPLVVFGLLFAVLSLYTARRVFDAPLERWEAGHYTSDDPVAFVYADSAAALPLPYQLAGRSRMWIVDHDTVVISSASGGRFGGGDRCRVLERDGEWLTYHDSQRAPCIDPHTGVDLDRADRVHVSDVHDRHGPLGG